jgi:hypothetical protein
MTQGKLHLGVSNVILVAPDLQPVERASDAEAGRAPNRQLTT